MTIYSLEWRLPVWGPQIRIVSGGGGGSELNRMLIEKSWQAIFFFTAAWVPEVFSFIFSTGI